MTAMRHIGTGLLLILFLRSACVHAADDRAGMRDAVMAMQRGDFPAAERKLRTEVAGHPDDAMALSLLGAALDNLQRPREAEPLHRRAVLKAPGSVDVLNNYAAHLLLAGQEAEARKVYLEVVARDSRQFNANFQLAQLAWKRGNAAETLRCLDRLPAERQQLPQALLLRMGASYRAGDATQAGALAAQLATLSAADPSLAVSAGIALSHARQYEKAEAFFETALRADPTSFNVLYDLGVSAIAAGHHGRAREVLEAALRQQPENVDALYTLASAGEASRQWEAAVQLLAQASRLDPRRADVQKLLAVTTTELGALSDAATAWERYLKLVPGDEAAARERDFIATRMGNFATGIAGLERFVAKHPDDVVGHYELGQAQRGVDVPKALAHLDTAIRLDSAYAPARTARGSLYYQDGKAEEARQDLEIAATLRPDDAANLDRLGQAYQTLDRTSDAVRVLRLAARLEPSDPRIQLHFGRALADAGNSEESKAVLERFRQLGPEKKNGVPAGFVDYLALTPEQRRASYRARVEKTVLEHPDDAAAQLDYLKLLIEDRAVSASNEDRVAIAARRVVALKPGPAVLRDAGRALLAGKQFTLAKEVLAHSPEAALDLAIATFYADGSDNAAAVLVERAFDEAIRATPDRPDVYLRAASFFVAQGRVLTALAWLDNAVRNQPQDRDVLLRRALTLELAGRTDDSEHQMEAIARRWPEWYPAWLARGMILNSHGTFNESRKALETGVALGAHVPAAYYFLADSAWHAGQAEVARQAIAEALRLAPGDPWIRTLAEAIRRSAGKDGSVADSPGREAPPWMKQLLNGAFFDPQ